MNPISQPTKESGDLLTLADVRAYCRIGRTWLPWCDTIAQEISELGCRAHDFGLGPP
jgi:hypothetical protein